MNSVWYGIIEKSPVHVVLKSVIDSWMHRKFREIPLGTYISRFEVCSESELMTPISSSFTLQVVFSRFNRTILLLEEVKKIYLSLCALVLGTYSSSTERNSVE